MFSNLNHSTFQTEKDETEYEGGGGTMGVGVGVRRAREEGNKYKNTLKKEKYIDTLYDDDFITNYFS